MEDQQFLIIGGGQLGRAFAKLFPEAMLLDFPQIDISKRESVKENLEKFAKTVKYVINTAAWTDVDGAENPANYDKVWGANSIGPANLAEICEELGMMLVHFSTDYVFGGENGNYREDDWTAPLNQYGQSKAHGEIMVRAKCSKYYIIRTSWLIGDNFPLDESKNFVKTIAKLILEKDEIRVVSDQFGRLTFTSDLVKATKHLLRENSPYGIYHISGQGKVQSWCEIARYIKFDLIRLGEESAKNCQIMPQSTNQSLQDKEFVALRPKRSDFNMAKIESTGFEPDWNTIGIMRYLENLQTAGFFAKKEES